MLQASVATAKPNRTRGMVSIRQRKVSGNSLCFNHLSEGTYQDVPVS